jgi:hypothetical protein
MKTNSILYLLLSASLVVACNTVDKEKNEIDTKTDQFPTKELIDMFYSTNESIYEFKHSGEYVNPLVIYSFIPWSSDQFPYWQEIDLTAADNSNRFFIDGEIKIEQSKHFNCPQLTYTPRNAQELEADFSSFSYVYLGRLNNGVELIYYREISTGSSIWNGLIGFSFSKRKVAGDSSEHIFMRKEKSYGLQQYCKFELDKQNNRVLVKPYENMMQADFASEPKDFFYVNFPKEATEALKKSLEE